MIYRMLFTVVALCYSISGMTDSLQGLDRLFTTQAQRAQLDVMRASEGIPGMPVQAEKQAGVKQKIVFNGSFRSSSGKLVYWINKQQKKPDFVEIVDTNNPQLLAFRDRDSQKVSTLKPGQSITVGSGQYRDYFDQADKESGPSTDSVSDNH